MSVKGLKRQFVLFFLDYLKIDNRWCRSNEEENGFEYKNLKEAKEACRKTKHCKMIYDVQSENKRFILCGTKSIATPSYSEKSAVYFKCKCKIDIFS